MRSFLLPAFLLVIGASAACAGSLTTVPVKGKEADVYAMRGQWEGEYSSADTGRKGSIRLSMRAGRNTADGEVDMRLPGTSEPRILRIAVLRVAGKELHGTLERYPEPSCNCALDAEFVGTLDGDVIDGSFTLHQVGTDKEMVGVWRVERTSK